MSDPFAKFFKEMAEREGRVDLGQVLEELMGEVALCQDADDPHQPDVLILVRCDQALTWLHTGVTFERATYMLASAQQRILAASFAPDDEDDDE